LHDGAIKSLYPDIAANSIVIELLVKRNALQGKNGPATLLDPCTIRLTFHELIEASLFDKFPTMGHYIESCIGGNNGEEVTWSFVVHDSASYIHEKYNWVIKAKWLSWKEVKES
jgi:hypothetical protein